MKRPSGEKREMGGFMRENLGEKNFLLGKMLGGGEKTFWREILDSVLDISEIHNLNSYIWGKKKFVRVTNDWQMIVAPRNTIF